MAGCFYALSGGLGRKIATNRTTAADTVSRGEKIKPTNRRAFGCVVRRKIAMTRLYPAIGASPRKIATNRCAGRDTVRRD